MTGTRKHYNDGFEGPPLEAGITWGLAGRLADATGLSSAAPIEPVPVSPVPASIPSAGLCDVCRTHQAKGVACSGLGPVSWAYCQACLDNNAEPLCMIAATIDGCGGVEGIADWVRDGVRSFVGGQYVSFDDAASGIAAATAGETVGLDRRQEPDPQGDAQTPASSS